MQTQATVQIVLDAVQAKYPGNEHVKQCGPKNHDSSCFDPSLPHLVYHVYIHQENCERDEHASCVVLFHESPNFDARWVPVNKSVVTDQQAAKP
jgi:hypothetical protein